jgi:hypothetical protein
MNGYTVQFLLPVDKPEENVRVTKRKGSLRFEFPINYPDVHLMCLRDMLVAAEEAELLRKSTPLNNTVLTVPEEK